MNIQYLLRDFVADQTVIAHLDFEVNGLSLNTKTLKLGDLFFAIKGQSQDGRTYLLDAIQKEACALVVEEKGLEPFLLSLNVPIPVIAIENLHQHLSEIAGRFYENPSAVLKVIGITGTNGKTTCAHLLSSSLNHLGIPCGVIGTLTHPLTTPDAITLQAELAEFRKQGMKAVAMEVSSHGLEQYRVQGIHFESAIFTNLTQDHLDYHCTMEAYGAAKQKLFYFTSLKRRILNAEDSFTQVILKETASPQSIRTFLYTREAHLPFELEGQYESIRCSNKDLTPHGIIAKVHTPWGEEMLHSKLVGNFNISNLLCILTELCLQGVALQKAIETLRLLLPPPGRMQRLGGIGAPLVLIDYAHTPDALYNALKAAREHCVGQLWCVFGCGGDRDRLKRPKMGHIAATLADKIIMTNDNPRHEPAKTIMMDILKGIPSEYTHPIIIEEDREKAIRYALMHASEQDVILIAGKGHEAYQLIGDHSFEFSDIACVQTYLGQP